MTGTFGTDIRPAPAWVPSLRGRLKNAADRTVTRLRVPQVRLVDYSDADLDRQRQSGFHSQHGQDHFLATEILAGYDGPRFFVEVGCNHPVRNNNSLHFERSGWTGISFDALSRFEAEWQAERVTPFHRVAISALRETRTFLMFNGARGWEHQLSGFSDVVKPRIQRRFSHDRVQVDCRPLHDFLAPGTAIGLLMVDVEGAEREVLRGIDLERFHPAYVLVENNRRVGGDPDLRRDLGRHGYRMIARIGGTDDLFQHP